MSSGRRDFERLFACSCPLHRRSRLIAGSFSSSALPTSIAKGSFGSRRSGNRAPPAGSRSEDVHSVDDRGFGCILFREDQAFEPCGLGEDRHGEARRAPALSGRRERFAGEEIAGEQRCFRSLLCGDDPDRDRQIEGEPSFLRSAGARVDRNLFERKGEPDVLKRCADPVAAFFYSGVGQPDHREMG